MQYLIQRYNGDQEMCNYVDLNELEIGDKVIVVDNDYEIIGGKYD